MRVSPAVSFKGLIFKIDAQKLNSSQEDTIWKMYGNWDGTKIDSFNGNIYLGVKDSHFEPAKDILDFNNFKYTHKQVSDDKLGNTNITKLVQEIFKIINSKTK